MLKDFKTIKDIIGVEEEFGKIRELSFAQEVLGSFHTVFPDLKKIAKAVKIDKEILYLKVDNSVWRNELNLRKGLIIEKLNKYYNKKIIKSIKFIS